MNDLDRETAALLWGTSTPEGRARHEWELAGGRPVYDRVPPVLSPRSFVTRCANPPCGAPIVVSDRCGNRRYCGPACVSGAHYWRKRTREEVA